MIGNGRTCALIDPRGSIDWLCLPRFDSPSVLGRLLDPLGGSFRVEPESAAPQLAPRPAYRPDTAIIETIHANPDGDILSITDWMPWGTAGLFRLVRGLRPGARARAILEPAFDYRRGRHRVALRQERVRGLAFTRIITSCTEHALHLWFPASAGAVRILPGIRGHGEAHIHLDLTRPAPLWLAHTTRDEPPAPPPEPFSSLDAEERAWRSWLSRSSYHGPHRELFRRSLVAMRLLCYQPSGAILAAATCSLSQHPGAGAAYDYRFCWIRDGAYAASALAEAGYPDEARAFVDFAFSVMDRECGKKPWQPLYGIGGERDCAEEELWHLEGFLGDAPVRIGNLAYVQLQNDLEGEVLEALWDLYLATRDTRLLAERFDDVRRVMEYVHAHWRDPDSGLWELRGLVGHYTHSKAMCFCAADRASRMARALGREREAAAFQSLAEDIRTAVLAEGFNDRLGAFGMALGVPLLDSSVLAIPLTGLLPASDERVERTVRRIEEELTVADMVQRNPFERSLFQLVTFWLARVHALRGDGARASQIIDACARHATDLGLFFEHLLSDPETPRPRIPALARTARDLILGHGSLAAFADFSAMLWRYFRHRHPTARKPRRPRLGPEAARLFRGNFPQLFSHEGLVRSLLSLERFQRPAAPSEP
jgi:GH15 family glucan-1,4-alpha-glucosidase